MPARNAASTIRLAIRSTLLALSELDRLIIITDSDDEETIATVRLVHDARIVLIISETGSSLPTKLNLGIESVNTAFVARMDSDDICLPWRFSLQRRQIVRHASDCVSSKAIIFGWSLRPFPLLPQIPLSFNNNEVYELLLTQNPIIHPTVLMKTACLRRLNGYSESPAEDYELWLRCALANVNLHCSWFPTILYRFSSKSMSRALDFKYTVQNDPGILSLQKNLRAKIQQKRLSTDLSRKKFFDIFHTWKKIKLAIARFSLGLNE